MGHHDSVVNKALHWSIQGSNPIITYVLLDVLQRFNISHTYMWFEIIRAGALFHTVKNTHTHERGGGDRKTIVREELLSFRILSLRCMVVMTYPYDIDPDKYWLIVVFGLVSLSTQSDGSDSSYLGYTVHDASRSYSYIFQT